jgi:hypothetical protein
MTQRYPTDLILFWLNQLFKPRHVVKDLLLIVDAVLQKLVPLSKRRLWTEDVSVCIFP